MFKPENGWETARDLPLLLIIVGTAAAFVGLMFALLVTATSCRPF